MLPVERKRRIVELVTRKSIASITALSKELGVSEATIRRDIAEIEQEGLLKRTYGGVFVDRSANIEPPFPERVENEVEQKMRIAQKAAEMIDDGDHIILDSGTTTPFIAKNIVNRRDIIVVTPDMNVAIQLREATGIKVIVTGGVLYRSGYVLNGMPALEFLNTVHVQKLFLGAQAVHPTYGITQTESELVQSKQAMIKAAQQTVLCADHTKIGKVTLHTVAQMQEIHTFITGTEAPTEQLIEFRDNGVRVVTA
ncbi:DeoR/GlpR family DNA-binding transcription regulator [Alicyclobacillus sp. SO9]|uniref:DeoR/GlpR family DNA-binding transcription regulator n=1 Tax=Alicyclobacillus sp. SO9 TaxID=2665646 RepID=UPI0018E77130|nr:DeoR/GlpR family DNA-binding transcription regulator [Alicyclobacillus sp. SO9]QQE77904.1 DeoR/GlpR transcriptional regulator [Alicyclobacillus sp. SO9]